MRSQALLDDAVKEGQPGCSAAVGERGEVLWRGVRGLADLGSGTEIDPDTIFDIASVSKQFTATAILLLEQAGKLSLSDPLSEHLSGYPKWAESLTLTQLMHHVSGIPEYLDLLEAAGHPLEEKTSRDLALSTIAGVKKLDFAPGSKWEYSNSNYLLLGAVIEKVTDQPLPDALASAIFTPLNLAMVADLQNDLVGKAHPYRPKGTSFEEWAFHADAIGAGGVQTTPSELVRWADNYRTGTLGSQALLTAQLADAALTDDGESSYGAGIIMVPNGGLTHMGDYGGFVTVFTVAPNRGRAVTVACNRSDLVISRIVDELTRIWEFS